MIIVDYLNEFERLYDSTKHHDTKLPTCVLAYCALKMANNSCENWQINTATLTLLTHECMKLELKTIYDNLEDSVSTFNHIIEKEHVFFWVKIHRYNVAMNANMIVVAIKITDKRDMIRKKILTNREEKQIWRIA